MTEIVVTGASYYSDADVAAFLGVKRDAPLPAPPDVLASRLQQRYVSDGYLFARVSAGFDEQSGRLTLTIDEGRFDAVEFTGVPPKVAQEMEQDFALQPGDVFRRREAHRALQTLLEPTQGKVRVSRRVPSGVTFTDTRQLRHLPATPFEMIQRAGKRVLVVHLETRRSDFSAWLGSHGREDWFNPVDGFAPSFGFSETIFDPSLDGYTYVLGEASYKFGPDRPGYALGIERPFFGHPRVFVSAEIHDQTATDDLWRLSPDEQSLAALLLKDSFRDYYRRRGYQVGATVRLNASTEVTGAWRDEREEALSNASDFSLFHRDESFPPNLAAQSGRLHSLLFAVTWDSRGLDEARAVAYERHQLVNLFGRTDGEDPGWSVRWTTEVASPGLGGDFDFRRHVLDVRRYNRLSPRNSLDFRVLAGTGDGLPPQRLFGIGGVGTVRGYHFKEAIGEHLALGNAEYSFRFYRDLAWLATYDVGTVFRAVAPANARWLHSVGTGLQIGKGFRIEAAWPLQGGRAAQVYVRFQPTF